MEANLFGIYKIQNKQNGKIYIGQSNDIERRIKEHCSDQYKSYQIAYLEFYKYQSY